MVRTSPHALSEALAKHNSRNPDSSILYLNYAAQDPALTNEKCNFWHFRFDAHVDMKLEAITNYIAQQKSIKKVYLLNQDYAFGQAISRAAKEMLSRKRPDIEIVGDDLHPLGKVKDFSPYVSKIKASGTETVITGNWGTDFTLLIKASKESGLGATFYTFNAQNAGAPSSIGAAGADHIKQVFTWHSNIADNGAETFANDYHRKYKDDFYYNTAKTELESYRVFPPKQKDVIPPREENKQRTGGKKLERETLSETVRSEEAENPAGTVEQIRMEILLRRALPAVPEKQTQSPYG